MKSIRQRYRDKGYLFDLDLRVKEHKKTRRINLFIIIIGIMILSSLFIFNQIMYSFMGIYSNQIVNVYQDDSIITGMALVCGEFNEEYKQIECVNNFIQEFYEYDYSRLSFNSSLILNPSELINEGGVCRDASVFYASVFEKLGFEYKFIFIPNHVYLEVYGENDTYVLDQQLDYSIKNYLED